VKGNGVSSFPLVQFPLSPWRAERFYKPVALDECLEKVRFLHGGPYYDKTAEVQSKDKIRNGCVEVQPMY
jgi:hypothetical protein